ncbi:MAG: Phenylalanine--tRNA ligase beta subunit [Eubacteriales bacterium SKADARSKE-1]|nr:Phenylalanine--tRNA ligase beta subunit [Eubacteriales bacterium SKADARSKE-1]
MNLSIRWLNEFVDINDKDIKEFCDKMTMTGSKVEEFEMEAEKINKVVTGKALSIEKHPDADKLLVGIIDVGSENPLQIVTGAKNLKVGDIVPVALDGSTLFDGTKIKKGKLRGVKSEGMLCSLSELGLSINDFPNACEDGIFVLDEPCDLGENIKDIIGFNDTKVDFEITPNRPDCLSIIGLAREAAATFNKNLNLHVPGIKAQNGNFSEKLDVTVEDAKLCPYYSAKIVKNVKIAPSPRWIRERLRAMGVRPINNIVDITNYVMLEYGQPLHAFDLRLIEDNKINVRRAKPGEKITTLDGIERELTNNNLVIADSKKPIAIAGVMGGEYSGIMNDTIDIVFESANFNGSSVRLTAKEHNMRTESSSLYEKGLDEHNCPLALDRACELIELLNIGDVGSKTFSCGNLNSDRTKVFFDCEFTNRFLNINLSKDKMQDILRPLGCEFEKDYIIVPTFRSDLKNKYDIAEEIARFYGYNNIPSTNLSGSSFGILSPRQKFEKKVAETMLALGVSEAITYPFISPRHFDKIMLPKEHNLRNCVKIANPLGEDTSVMRTVAVISMLDLLSKNFNNKNENVRLFEIAKEYIPQKGASLPNEKTKLIVGFYGENIDFLYAKGIVEELLSNIFVFDYDVSAYAELPYYHPGRCAKFTLNEDIVGIVGEIHPSVCENYDIKKKVYAIELDIDMLFENAKFDIEYKAIPKFPSVKRDLALICDDDVPVLALQKIIKLNAAELLEDISIFDIYKGEQIPESKKSVAFNLTLRSSSATLTEEQVNSIIKKIVSSLEKQGITIRDGANTIV